MIDVTITPLDLDAAIRDLGHIDGLVMDEMDTTMRRAVNVVEAAVVQFTPVGVSGNTRQAWSTSVERGLSAVKGIVSNPLDYSYYVEHGRRPGRMPPIAPIELWVRRVLGIGQPQSRQVAFLVARAIGRRGTKGAHMAEKGVAAVRGIVEADFRSIPARVAAKV